MFRNNLISILDISPEQQTQLFEMADRGKMLFSDYRHALDDKVLAFRWTIYRLFKY